MDGAEGVSFTHQIGLEIARSLEEPDAGATGALADEVILPANVIPVAAKDRAHGEQDWLS
jgi:hypothetical protein